MQLSEAREKLAALQAKIAAYDHAMGLMYYDGSTVAPKRTAANRAQSLGILSEEIYKLSTGEESVALLEYLDARRKELNFQEQRQVYLLLKDIRFMQMIPMAEYVAFEKLLAEA